jgi:hypothetical protein
MRQNGVGAAGENGRHESTVTRQCCVADGEDAVVNPV